MGNRCYYYPVPSLSSFQEVKRRPDGRRQVYPCRLLAREAEVVILHYRLTTAWTVGTVRLQPGDDTIAYFWPVRPYNLYHWLRPQRVTAGYYFNLARKTEVFDDRLEWTDLGLDLLVLPDGRATWVDQEEVAALPAADREAVALARVRLEREYPQVVAWAAGRSKGLRLRVPGGFLA